MSYTCGRCPNKATQRLIKKTMLLSDKEDLERGDTWHSSGRVMLCDSCSKQEFDTSREPPEKREENEKEIAELRDTLEGLVYWNENGSIDQSWWDDAEKLISRDEEAKERS